MPVSLENKVAIVTGAAGGIGFAIAKRFVQDGAKVVIADQDETRGEAAEAELKALGDVLYVHCNVAEKLDVRNLVAATLDAYGDIDVLVNNAGIVVGADFLDLDEADFDRVLSVNLKGAFLCSQAVARHMVAKVKDGGTPGTIINMSSVASSLKGVPNRFAYSTTKAAVIGLTKSIAADYVTKGIRCNAICPGTVDSPSLQDRLKATGDYEKARTDFIARQPIGRIGTPEEIADLAVYLAGATYTTGQAHVIDGGWTA